MARGRRRGKRTDDPAGVLVVDKAVGPTSHDAVALVRRKLDVGRVGHTGTLDPMASGVLVMCLGEATKLAGYLTATQKDYETTVRLGQETDSHDATGQVTAEYDAEVTARAIEEALGDFRGQIAQTPPMFSALKHKGQRLYKLARRGEVVDREPRIVHVHRLELTRFEFPYFDLSMTCGKGTYVRTLAHDIGHAVGSGAHLVSLVRTRVGRFGLDAAIGMEELEAIDSEEARRAVLSRLIPMGEAMDEWPSVQLDARGVNAVGHGRGLGPGDVAAAGGGGLRPGQMVRMLDENGALVALGEMKSHGLHPVRVFRSA